MKSLVTMAVAATIAGAAGAASATTFDLTTVGGTYSAYTFTQDGIDMTVSAATFDGSGFVDNADVWFGGAVGAGIVNTGETADFVTIDGIGLKDVMVLTFSEKVVLESLSFTYWTGNGDSTDEFTLFVDSSYDASAGLTLINSYTLPGAADLYTYAFVPDWTGALGTQGSAFGVGALGDWDDFKMTAVEVSAVPIPATLPLMAASLLGFAAFRRRARSA